MDMNATTPSGPLSHLSVVDFGTGLAGALACRVLSGMGARIIRAEPEGGDPFYQRYAAYGLWQGEKEVHRFADIPSALAALAGHLETADLCICGGEDFPGFQWSANADDLARTYPRLVTLATTGGGAGEYDTKLIATDLLVQARSGLMFEQLADRPSVFAFPAGAYGAALQGLGGLFAALCERERSGLGQVVRTSLFEGVLSWLSNDWYKFGPDVPVARDVTPKGAIPLILKCADDAYIHIILASTDARKNVFTVLGVENPTPSLEEDPRGMPSNTRPARYYYENIDMLAPYVAKWRRADLLNALWERNVSAEAVNRPGAMWDDEQIGALGLLETDAQGHRQLGLPFDYRAVPAPSTGTVAHGDNAGPEASTLPLVGLKAVDFGTFVAGPHTSLMLRDFGADVVKIEPIGGDPMRFYFLKFTGSSRGKRVIELDLKQTEGLEIARKLCERADFVNHNFRPGVTDRLGIDEHTLRRENPDLIMVETSAYGQSGPKALNGGFDMIFHSYVGHSVRAAGDGKVPRNYRLPIIDFSSGLLGGVAMLIGQYIRLQSGSGALCKTSLLNSSLFLLSELVQYPDGQFCALPALDDTATGFHPAERIYAAAGGEWVAISALDDAMAATLLNALELNHEISRPRSEWDAREAGLIAAALADRQVDEIIDRLTTAGIWAERCRRDAMDRLFADKAMRSHGTVVDDDDPDHGAYAQLGTLVRLSRSGSAPGGRSPRRGEHTREILAELGYTEAQTADFYQKRIVA